MSVQRARLISRTTAPMLARMSEQPNTDTTKTTKPAVTARLPPALFQDITAISWAMSRPGAVVANGSTLGLLAGVAIAGIRGGKLRARDFATLAPSDLFEQTILLAGAPPAQETDEERRKREAEEQADREGPGPVGRPQRGKGLLVGEGPKGGPKKGGRR